MLYSNCSEATMRINLSDYSESEIAKLKKILEDLSEEAEKEDEGGDENKDNNNSNSLRNEDGDLMWYETSWDEETLFGIKVISINGETPYNYGEELEAFLKKKCYFIKDKDIEYSEP